MTGVGRRPGLPATEETPSVEIGAMRSDELAATMLRAQTAALSAAIEPELPAVARAIDAIAEQLGRGGRFILLGAGTSGRLGLIQAAEAGPTFGIEPGSVVGILAGLGTSVDPRDPIATSDDAEDDEVAGSSVVDELKVGRGDALVGIAASGRTPYTIAAVKAARARGALTIALACTAPSPLAASAGLAIQPVVGAELLAGSTRLAAGSATKAILDILTTGAMVRLGRVHRDRMIDVQARNAKLRNRAVGIVADMTGRPDAEAEDALAAVGWSARAAIIQLSLGLDPVDAVAHASAHRFLADALASPPADVIVAPRDSGGG